MNFTRRQRTTCLLAFLLVVVGLIAGLTLPLPRPVWELRDSSSISYNLRELWIIASRNLQVGVQLVLGTVSLGIYSLIQLLSLGFSLGFLLSAAQQAGLSRLSMIILLAPHSLLEFAGFIVLGAIEFEAAWLVYLKLRHDQLPFAQADLRRLLQQTLLGFALIIVAALIEVYVTGPLGKRFT